MDDVVKDPEDLAEEANLRYVTDAMPGFIRVPKGKGFSYYDLKGDRITDERVIERIEALRIPPAWENVWISPVVSGHIQAIGKDEKGRKQYIYHQKWIELSNQNKFNKMLYFSEALPNIRAKIEEDMNISSLSQERILATIVWLLDHTYIRIGNEEYAKDNQHYGLTTLRNKHVDVDGSTVTFAFVGKSGKKHAVGITHPRVARTIRRLEEIPGYELFQYIDENGDNRPVDSQDVNDYIKQITQEPITAKDFRTWGGTVLSASILHEMGEYQTKTELKKNVRDAVCQVAKHLGNTPTVCRGYYIHPVIPQTYEKKILVPHFEKVQSTQKKKKGLSRAEFATVTLLQKYQ